jgi:hypothetical protein
VNGRRRVDQIAEVAASVTGHGESTASPLDDTQRVRVLASGDVLHALPSRAMRAPGEPPDIEWLR